MYRMLFYYGHGMSTMHCLVKSFDIPLLLLANFVIKGRSVKLSGVFTCRAPDSDAWTKHRTISTTKLSNKETKAYVGSHTDLVMANYPHEDAEKLGFEKSEEAYKTWEQYWITAMEHKTENIFAQGSDSKDNINNGTAAAEVKKANGENGANGDSQSSRRWIFAMRHGERVDLTYGAWVPFCFDQNETYTRKDLNMPLSLPPREGGADAYAKDSPLTRMGRMQAYLVGEGLRVAAVPLKHVYSSPSLRCVETAHNMLQGLQAGPSVKVRVEPALFEYKLWHASKGMGPFMTPLELHKAGYNVDLEYKPYYDMDVYAPETMEEFYKRNEFAIQESVKGTETEGGNIMFVGHATTLDITVTALKRLRENKTDTSEYKVADFLNRVPYCALGAMRDKPLEVVSPPCPPSVNTSSGRFDWKLLLNVQTE